MPLETASPLFESLNDTCDGIDLEPTYVLKRWSRCELEMMSAVELACFLNQREILRLMVSHDNSINQERYVAFIYTIRPTT